VSTSSDSVSRKLLEILEEAIERERISQQRYALGASLASDPALKQMFLRLIEDEMSHERILRERQTTLKGAVDR
jgi:rubrerythrin